MTPPDDKVPADARELALQCVNAVGDWIAERNTEAPEGVVAAILAPVVARMNEAEAELRESPGHLLRRARNAEARAVAAEAAQVAAKQEVERLTNENTLLSAGPAAAGWWSPATAKAYEKELADLRAQLAAAQEAQTVLAAWQSAFATTQLSHALAKLEAAQEDTADMNWLELQSVEVSTPLRYGSKELFCVAPFDGDGEEQPSRLREAVRAARREGGGQ